MLCSNSYRTDSAYETNNGKTHKVAHAGLYGGGVHNRFRIDFPAVQGVRHCSCCRYCGGGILFSKKCFFKDKIIQEESEPVFRTGIAELDESLEQANVLIEQLRRANISIKNPAVSAHIDRMTRSGDAILAELNAHPEKARKLRRFLTYYLPTSVKFMQTYAEHEAAPTGGENSAEIMRGIENNSETIAKAFETSLDSLYAGEALDISSDIDVLNGMVNAKTSMFE